MGRFVTVDGEYLHKFWFGVQGSGDILEFGWEDDGINGYIDYECLDDHIKKVDEAKKKFKKKHDLSFFQFMKKMKEKGYQKSSSDEETNTDKWASMCRDASFIDLGNKIIKKLKKDKDGFSFYAEC